MRKRVAIVGSGPTAIFALQQLITCAEPLSISVFEAEQVAGKGTPYQRGINDAAMMSNIPSIEIPTLPETLVGWMEGQSDSYLAAFGIERCLINDREFYPRVVLGDFLQAQFQTIIESGLASRHAIRVYEQCPVTDVLKDGDILNVAFLQGAELQSHPFDHVVLATGHSFPSAPEVLPGYFVAPWPATALKDIPAKQIGVLGTSLSAIDAIMTLATSFGQFRHDTATRLEYFADEGRESFSITMMSRKGLLPEADYFFPLPYEKPKVCTDDAVGECIQRGSRGLLDAVFELFRQEILIADPAYAAAINLEELTADTFADAYYRLRSNIDAFIWAEQNLEEAKRNYRTKHTVAWRYTILVTHEVIEHAVRHFDADDLDRFNKSFKSIFADDYATVPHVSIERLLALHRAGHLSIQALGSASVKRHQRGTRGATVCIGNGNQEFDTLIDATGQKSLSADDLPFSSLVAKGVVTHSTTVTRGGNQRRTGGIDVDDKCRPVVAGVPTSRRLYLPAVAYLLHKRPFVQGITSAAELGQAVARAIVEEVTRSRRVRRKKSIGVVSAIRKSAPARMQ